MFETMRKVVDAIQVNLPIGGAFAVISLSEWEIIAKIGTLIIGTICTVIVTIHKIKEPKDK